MQLQTPNDLCQQDQNHCVIVGAPLKAALLKAALSMSLSLPSSEITHDRVASPSLSYVPRNSVMVGIHPGCYNTVPCVAVVCMRQQVTYHGQRTLYVERTVT